MYGAIHKKLLAQIVHVRVTSFNNRSSAFSDSQIEYLPEKHYTVLVAKKLYYFILLNFIMVKKMMLDDNILRIT